MEIDRADNREGPALELKSIELRSRLAAERLQAANAGELLKRAEVLHSSAQTRFEQVRSKFLNKDGTETPVVHCDRLRRQLAGLKGAAAKRRASETAVNAAGQFSQALLRKLGISLAQTDKLADQIQHIHVLGLKRKANQESEEISELRCLEKQTVNIDSDLDEISVDSFEREFGGTDVEDMSLVSNPTYSREELNQNSSTLEGLSGGMSGNTLLEQSQTGQNYDQNSNSTDYAAHTAGERKSLEQFKNDLAAVLPESSIENLTAWQNLDQQGLSLTYVSSSRRRIGVQIQSSDDKTLTIRLKPSDSLDRRVLWQEKNEISKLLSQHGYTVLNVIIETAPVRNAGVENI